MASDKTLNAKNLAALGAERLAELLLELATGDAVAKRRLRLELDARTTAALRSGWGSAANAAYECWIARPLRLRLDLARFGR